MKRVAKFEKVNFEQFKTDWLKFFDKNDPTSSSSSESVMRELYDKIELPVRASGGSGGYDLYSPLSFRLDPGDDIMIPTGIRIQIDEGWCFVIIPRSGIGNKYYVRIAGTVGLIDNDYYYSKENTGHCYIKIRNEGDKTLYVSRGDRICQGVFLEFGITYDDDVTAVRDGGFGSSGK